MQATIAQSIKQFITEEASGWKAWEVAWFAFSCLTVLGLSLYWHDTPMGITSAVTGIAYTLCNGKGKRVAFVFGFVNALLYAIISLQARYYGEAMLNGLYYLPMMIWGFSVWTKSLDEQTHEVVKLRMGARRRAALLVGIAVGIVGYGLVLRALGGALPFVDSFTTVVSVAAMVVAVRRYMEQWAMWTAVNAVTVAMWAVNFAAGGESVATLVMWAVYLVTGIIMWVKWAREAR